MTGPFDRHFLQQECGYTLVETLPHDLLHEPHDIGEARGHQFVGIVGNRRRSFHDALINFGRYYPKVSVLFRLNGHFELNGTHDTGGGKQAHIPVKQTVDGDLAPSSERI